eukprot:CAMPEP_0203965400 /NCGR_PEP_ID=MMETSP0359-20131031/94904_1 /ASSEMBLY_ACC=CAM_ASM_000338 /TAXON_ID=268821 /ORGANISM="Scrippsiella Hangoei, Strain SHTV-5" /LENGTH=85 /DNA_ID=CAMNT_0050902285 /DNA_START=47 /DNA_END=304 /DNA_ORIENTATION=+
MRTPANITLWPSAPVDKYSCTRGRGCRGTTANSEKLCQQARVVFAELSAPAHWLFVIAQGCAAATIAAAELNLNLPLEQRRVPTT